MSTCTFNQLWRTNGQTYSTSVAKSIYSLSGQNSFCSDMLSARDWLLFLSSRLLLQI